MMNGAESLLRSLVDSGVELCVTKPGTSEMHFVAALDRVPGMRAVLGLQENVVTGAADGYGRMADKPASTLLHLGPGLAKGMGVPGIRVDDAASLVRALEASYATPGPQLIEAWL